MGLEALIGVWLKADVGGSRLLVLMALANFADTQQVATVEVEILAQRARLEIRRTQQVLGELEQMGLLNRVLGGGRGRPSSYQILMEVPTGLIIKEKVQRASPKGARNRGVLETETVQPHAPIEGNGAENCTVPLETLHTAAPFGGETLNGVAPFGAPPIDEERDKKNLSSSQQLVAEVGRLFKTAGVRPPSPGQIGTWAKALPPGELLGLVADLVGRGLAEKSNPAAYVHACVLAKAKGEPRARRPLPKTLGAGADATRRDQAAHISRASREACE